MDRGVAGANGDVAEQDFQTAAASFRGQERDSGRQVDAAAADRTLALVAGALSAAGGRVVVVEPPMLRV